MPLLGAHMSIAGGYYKAVDAAKEVGCDCVQIFTKNNNQWRAKPISDEDVQRFQVAMKSHGIEAPLSHASYLINLGSGSKDLWQRSVDGMVEELRRATLLGIQNVVVHPGSHGESTAEEGIERVAEAIDAIHKVAPAAGAKIALECTAGQGASLGWKLEHLSSMISQCKKGDRVRVCLDTCHLFAAGYEFDTPKKFAALVQQIDELIGVENVCAIHMNDSKRELGSRVDRHDHIGQGKIGLDAFRLWMRSKEFANTPRYLETPKEKRGDEDWDVINLRTLRELVSDGKGKRKTATPRRKVAKNG